MLTCAVRHAPLQELLVHLVQLVLLLVHWLHLPGRRLTNAPATTQTTLAAVLGRALRCTPETKPARASLLATESRFTSQHLHLGLTWCRSDGRRADIWMDNGERSTKYEVGRRR